MPWDYPTEIVRQALIEAINRVPELKSIPTYSQYPEQSLRVQISADDYEISVKALNGPYKQQKPSEDKSKLCRCKSSQKAIKGPSSASNPYRHDAKDKTKDFIVDTLYYLSRECLWEHQRNIDIDAEYDFGYEIIAKALHEVAVGIDSQAHRGDIMRSIDSILASIS